jgi:ADP-heptose:LPS heptosyltransferase
MGITSPQDTREVFVSNDAEQKVEMWRKKIPAQVRIVGISISAGNKIKELGDDKFAHIARTLLAKKDTAIVCIGSPADIPRIKKFIADVGSPLCFDGTGFNLEELPSLMKRFSLYIAVDTGPIYIAHALGIPLIDIIGPVDPTEQPPKDARSIQVLPRGNVEPSSFVFKKRGEPQQIKQALEMTFTDDILSAAFSLLK